MAWLSLDHLMQRPRLVPGAIAVVSLAALAAALLAQYVGGLQPCILCVYQRYPYVAALLVAVPGLAFASHPTIRRLAVAVAGLAFLVGAAVAAFHVGVEQHWWRGTAACAAPAIDPSVPIAELRARLLASQFVPCDEVAWSLFGMSMAGYNLLTSVGLAAACFWVVAHKGTAKGR